MDNNRVMNRIWLLNALSNSLFEAKGLALRLLEEQEGFAELRRNNFDDPEEKQFVEEEIQRGLASLAEINELLERVTQALANNG